MLIIQAVTINGEILEKGKWNIETLNNVPINTGHSVCISLYTSDKDLLNYIQRQNKSECCLDKSKNGEISIIATFIVKEIRHMIDRYTFQSLCTIEPINRFVEQAVLFLLNPGKCDKRFVETVHG